MPSYPTASARNVSISADDARELEGFANECEAEQLRHFEHFLIDGNSHVDRKRWKQLKVRNGVAVYCARDFRSAQLLTQSSSNSSSNSNTKTDRSHDLGSSQSNVNLHSYHSNDSSSPVRGHNSNHSSGNSNSSSHSFSRLSASSDSTEALTMEIGPIAAISATSSQPVLLLSGTLLGTVDDYMYAFYTQDTVTIRERNVYMDNKIYETSIMCSLETATVDDPFRYLGFGWFKLPLPRMGGLIKPRDAVVLVHSRMTTISNGERVGIWLCHSIESDAMPPCDDGKMLRAKMCAGNVFYQVDATHVQVYQLNFMDLGGQILAPLAKAQINELLLSITQLQEAIVLRKLAWAMRHRIIPHNRSHGDLEESCCGSCGRDLARHQRNHNCQLCLYTVCNKCRIEKMLIVEASGSAIVTKPFEFCTKCILAIKSTSAYEIARREAIEAVASQKSDGTSSSSHGGLPTSISATS